MWVADWWKLFCAAIEMGGQAEVARELGYSRSTVSQVAGCKYTGDLEKFGRRVIEVYGTEEDKRMVIPEGYVKNKLGHLVRVEDVSALDRLRDDLARDMIREAAGLAEMMAGTKQRWLADLQALLQTAAEQYGATNMEGKNGDFAIMSFDGRIKVERVHRKLMAVDTTKATIAKELVDRVVDQMSHELSGDARRAVRAAFRRDDKGNYSATGLLSIVRRIKLPDNADWQRAVAAIHDAVSTEFGEPYVRFYELDKDGKTWRQVSLDMATVVVEMGAEVAGTGTDG